MLIILLQANMNIKGKKVILIDEVSQFLNCIERTHNENNNPNTFEHQVNSYLKTEYTIFDLNKTKSVIEIVNKMNLLPEEKFKLVNFKPQNLIELSIVCLLYNNIYIIVNIKCRRKNSKETFR